MLAFMLWIVFNALRKPSRIANEQGNGMNALTNGCTQSSWTQQCNGRRAPVTIENYHFLCFSFVTTAVEVHVFLCRPFKQHSRAHCVAVVCVNMPGHIVNVPFAWKCSAESKYESYSALQNTENRWIMRHNFLSAQQSCLSLFRRRRMSSGILIFSQKSSVNRAFHSNTQNVSNGGRIEARKHGRRKKIDEFRSAMWAWAYLMAWTRKMVHVWARFDRHTKQFQGKYHVEPKYSIGFFRACVWVGDVVRTRWCFH